MVGLSTEELLLFVILGGGWFVMIALLTSVMARRDGRIGGPEGTPRLQ